MKSVVTEATPSRLCSEKTNGFRSDWFQCSEILILRGGALKELGESGGVEKINPEPKRC